MIDVVVTLVPALLWLAYRAIYVLMSPVDELVEELSIDVPDFPPVTIDQVSASLAILRWDSMPNSYDEVQFAIVVNDHVVANVSSLSCKLTKLVPNQKYMVSVRACSPITHFHAYSPAICIQTVSDDDLTILRTLEESSLEAATLTRGLFKLTSLHPTNNNSKSPDNIDVFSMTPDKVFAITEMTLLNEYAAALKDAARTMQTDMNDHDTATNYTCAQLASTIAERKTEYDQELDTKTKSDLSVKALERNKDKLTYQKSKLVSQISALKSSLDLSRQKLQEKQQELQKIKHRRTLLLENEDRERSKIHQEIGEISSQLAAVKDDMHCLDEKFKALQVEKRRTVQTLLDLRPLVTAFSATVAPISNQTSTAPSSGLSLSLATRSRSNSGAAVAGDDMFGKDGKIHSRVVDALESMLQLVPAWREEVWADASACQTAESEWRDSFRSSIERYVAAHWQLEVAKLKHDRNYEPMKITEHQASIEYGGAANALPKRSSKGLSRNFSPPVSSKKEMPQATPLTGSNSFTTYTDVYGADRSTLLQDLEAGHAPPHYTEPAIFSDLSDPSEQLPGYSNSMFVTPESEPHRFPGKYGALASHTFGDIANGGSPAGYLYDDINGGTQQGGLSYADGNGSGHQTGYPFNDTNPSNPQAGYPYRDQNGHLPHGGYPVNAPLSQLGYAYDGPNTNTRPQRGFPYDDSAYNLQLPVEPHKTMGGGDYCPPAFSYPTDAGASSILLAPSVTNASMSGQYGQTLSMPDLHEPFGFSRPLLGNSLSGRNGQSHAHTGGRTFAKLLHSGAGSWMSDKFGFSTTPPSKGPSPLWTGTDEGEGLARSSSIHGPSDPMDLSGHTRSVSLNSHIWRSSDDSTPAHHFDLGAVSDMMGQDEFSPFPSRKSWEP